MNSDELRRKLAELKQKEQLLEKSIGVKPENDLGASAPSPALRYTWLGAEFAAIFIGFVYGGYTLDQRLGTKPWLILIGIAAGFGLALYRLIFVAQRLNK